MLKKSHGASLQGGSTTNQVCHLLFFNKPDYFMKMSLIKPASIILFAFSMLVHFTAQAQDSKKERAAKIKSLIESKRYVFIAERALPVTGRNVQLTPGYQLEIKGDSLISDLPYFGRAYTAPIDPSKGGFQFTSPDNEYSTEAKKNGTWYIVAKPKDSRDVNQFALDISKTGRATLQVISNNRQPISFNGYIAEAKLKK